MSEYFQLSSTKNRIGPWAGPSLIWSCLLLLPFGRSVEIPIFLMAFAGVYLLVRGRLASLDVPAFRLFTLVFLSLWIPILLSLPDAYNRERTLIVAANHWRFYFSGLFIIWVLVTEGAHHRFQTLCAWLLVFWIFDAVFQAIVGVNILGMKPWNNGISGLFGAESSKFAVTLAVLTPVLWTHARRAWPVWFVVFVSAFAVFAVLGGGSRAAWVALAVVFACYFIASATRVRGRFISRGIGTLLAISFMVLVAYQSSPAFRGRIDMTVAELTGEQETLKSSLQHRVYIWRAAWNMFLDHPMNGVGARGFRYAFGDYAAMNDPFFIGTSSITPTHTHNLITELAAETGTLGVAGFAIIVLLLSRAAWQTRKTDSPQLMPYGVALIAANFPLNTHWAIFSAYWSQVVWWLIALYCALYGAKMERATRALAARSRNYS